MNKQDDKFLLKSLDAIMSDRFARYSKYIIQQRALPDARDGLKPVQRRILYSMWELGLKHDKAFKKSARVVGDVIGKYHPHGDSSIYEAMIRMGQEWKMNVPLIEMHGNKGSIDDDPAAAMRYTETRLEKITNLMLESIDKKSIPFAPNFDDSEKEPTVLPTMIPNLLINGARGIASGFATEIPPHNLGEILDAIIEKIKNPKITLEKLMNFVHGPDFPTGGTIYGTKGIYQAFDQGQGRIVLVSKYKIINEAKHKSIEITEIPYGIVKSKLVKDIDEIRIDQKISGIKEVRDQTDRNGISILIELENDAKLEAILNYLLQKTEMQIYYSYNSIAIKNNSPTLMSLINMIETYLEHVKLIKTNELKYDLAKDENKLEIVEGFIRVGDITDAVIKVIRASDNSKKGVILDLQKHFNFTELQATAIAEMRLYRLSRIDQEAYIAEKQMLEDRINFAKNLLNNENEFNKWLINLFKNIKKEFATPRKTEILDQEFKIEINQEELIKNEVSYLGITHQGYIKKISLKTYDSNQLNTYGLKEKDYLTFFSKVESINKILIFTNLGNYIYLPVHKIEETKWKEIGKHLNDFVLLKSDEKIINAILIPDFDALLYVNLVTKEGIGKKVLLKDFEVSRFNKTISAIKLKSKNDKLVDVKLSNGNLNIIIFASNGKAVKYKEDEIPIYNTNSSGVKLISLAQDSEVQGFVLAKKEDQILLTTQKAQFKKMNFNDLEKANKTTQGKNAFLQNKVNKICIFKVEVLSPQFNDLWIFNSDNNIERFDVKDINVSLPEEGFSNSKNKMAYGIFINNNKEWFTANKVKNTINKKVENSISKEKTNDVIKKTKPKKETNQNSKIEPKLTEEDVMKKIDALDSLDIDSLIKKIDILNDKKTKK